MKTCSTRKDTMKQKPLRLNEDGTLVVDEKDVTEQIISFLALHGWDCLRTPASRVQWPSGKWGWIFEEGFADHVCVRPVLDEPHLTEFFYAELKANKSNTNKKRKAAQEEFARRKTEEGFLCYVAPDKGDQFELFKKWYDEQGFNG